MKGKMSNRQFWGNVLILTVGAVAIIALIMFWRVNFVRKVDWSDHGASYILDNTLLQNDKYYEKEEITEITFLSTLSIAPKRAWDFSLVGDRSVIAWKRGTQLYIAAEGGVIANIKANGLFEDYESLVYIDLKGLDTSKVTDMSEMFRDCWLLTTLNLSSFDTSNVKDMSSMFNGCSHLASIDISGFDTSNVTDMESMFSSCRSLKTVDFSGIDTSKVKNMQDMFYFCRSLYSLDLSDFDTSSVTSMNRMFYYCESLSSLVLPTDFFVNDPDVENMFKNAAISEPTSYK